MVTDENASGNDDVFLTVSDEQQLGRQLIEQFYRDSTDRYGSSSEKARMFSMLLAEFDS